MRTPLPAALLFALLLSSLASARPTRPRFEPTDLELEDTGVAELDLQVGASHGTGASGNRLLLPDFELDIGLLPNVELDLDGSFSVDAFDGPGRTLAGEALWPAMKLGLFDVRSGGRALAGGLQLGPRIPTIGTRGIGYAALGLFGVGVGRVHTVLNLGGIVDPGDQITSGQSKSLVAGLDVDTALDARGAWSLLGELATAHYLSGDPDELTATLGAAWSATPALDLSAIALVGFLPGQDRAAVLLGMSPKLPIW
jgi:hypothetical protein